MYLAEGAAYYGAVLITTDAVQVAAYAAPFACSTIPR